MPRAVPIQCAFNAGEWSELLSGQVRLDKYGLACKRLENFVLCPHGPAMSRPGLYFVHPAKYATKKARLEKFIFSNKQAYILEFGDKYIRFFMDDGFIESSPGVPYEIASPYNQFQVEAIQVTQNADVLYLWHPSHFPRKLTRFAHNSWTLTTAPISDGPYLRQNMDGTRMLIPSATSGNGITLTAEYGYPDQNMGTYGDAVTGQEPFLTPSRRFAVTIFTTPAACRIGSVKVNIAAPGSTSMTAHVYTSDGSRATGSPLATSNSVHIGTTGEKTLTFESCPVLNAAALYAIVIQGYYYADAITTDKVADTTSYLTGYAATATGNVTQLTGADWRINIQYRLTGYPDVFQPGHVGTSWRIRTKPHVCELGLDPGSNTSATETQYGAFWVDVEQTSTDRPWVGTVYLEKSWNQVEWYTVASFTAPTKQSFFENDPTVKYRFRQESILSGTAVIKMGQDERWALVKIVSYINGHAVTADVVAPFENTDGSSIWCEPAWSDVRGFPATGSIRNDRLCAASTEYQPYTEWASWASDYDRFMPGDTEESAWTFTYSELNNRIAWIENATDPLVGTVGEEARLVLIKQAPMSATNPPKVETQSTEGSAQNHRPIRIGPAFVFIDVSQRRLLETSYDLESNTVTPTPLNLFAEHITAGGIRSIAYQKNPNSIIWCTRADGVMPGLTYYRKEAVLGWHRLITKGKIESIAVVPSALGGQAGHDRLWMVVRRVINGEVKRFIEYMADHDAIRDAHRTATTAEERLEIQKQYMCLDAALTYNGDPVSTLSGLDHLEGHTVSIVADGLVLPPQVVKNGSITLEAAASIIHVGLPYTCVLETMNIEAGTADGTAQGRRKKIRQVIFRFLHSLGGKYGKTEDDLYDLPTVVPDVQSADELAELVNDDLVVDWPGDWERAGRVMIVQDQPLPMTVAAAVITVETND
jgi:hypothetical protein